MFGNKKDPKQSKEKIAELRINTIPGIFYGGNDPDIYHHEVDTQGSAVLRTEQSYQSTKKINSSIATGSRTDHVLTGKKKKMLAGIFFGILFLLFVGGSIWYYTKDRGRPVRTVLEKEHIPIAPVALPASVATSTEFETVAPIESVLDTTPTTTVESSPSPTVDADLSFPALVLRDSEDLDKDQLTDLEEELFETDSGDFDTDKDGYFDGQEVFNLYNPRGLAPRRIIDSGLVKEYINPGTNYRLYYPITWQAGEVDTIGTQVLFSGISGDYIEVRAFEKSSVDTFPDWFARAAQGQKITDLMPIKNRFKVDGWRRRDDLVAYFVDRNTVYVVLFHPAKIGPIAYRHIVTLLAQSFRYATTKNTLEEQPIISEPGQTPTSSATGTEIIAPVSSTRAADTTSDDSLSNG